MDLDLLLGFPCINKPRLFIRDLLFAMTTGMHMDCLNIGIV